MAQPSVIKEVKVTHEFTLALPSGNGLYITLRNDTPKEDVEFVERVLEIACAERGSK